MSSAVALRKGANDHFYHSEQDENRQLLESVFRAYGAEMRVSWPDRQPHMRLAWKGAVSQKRVTSLVSSLGDHFGSASCVKLAGGGADHFSKNFSLDVHLEPVASAMRGGDSADGHNIIQECLEDSGFRQICSEHGVKHVFTPKADYTAGAVKPHALRPL